MAKTQLNNNLHSQKYIKLSLQDKMTTLNAINFNYENDFEYTFLIDGLIRVEELEMFIRNGYIVDFNNDFKNMLVLRYKKEMN